MNARTINIKQNPLLSDIIVYFRLITITISFMLWLFFRLIFFLLLILIIENKYISQNPIYNMCIYCHQSVTLIGSVTAHNRSLYIRFEFLSISFASFVLFCCCFCFYNQLYTKAIRVEVCAWSKIKSRRKIERYVGHPISWQEY